MSLKIHHLGCRATTLKIRLLKEISCASLLQSNDFGGKVADSMF